MGRKSTKEPVSLSDKEEHFCQLYFLYLNRARAAHRAGYATSTRTARYAARDLWKRGDIQARIGELREEWKERLALTLDGVLRELAAIARADIADVLWWDGKRTRLVPISKISKDKRRAIKEIYFEFGKPRVKLYDKQDALQSIADILGVSKCKPETGKGGEAAGHTTVILNIPDNGRKPKN